MIFEFDDFDVRDRFYGIDEKTQRLNLYLEALLPKQMQHFREMCEKAYLYHDSALDGVVLSNEEIATVLNVTSGFGQIKSRVLQEIASHREALRQMVTKIDDSKHVNSAYQCEIITYDEVIELHQMLYGDALRKEPGKLRKVMPLHSSYFHTFTDPKHIEEKLRELCEQTADPDFRAQHPINQAIIFHYQFMRIFPFLIGTGRIGRLLMNGFLMQGGYKPAIIHTSERQRYYETLRDPPEDLRDLVLEGMESGLEAQLKFLKHTEIPESNYKMVTRSVNVA